MAIAAGEVVGGAGGRTAEGTTVDEGAVVGGGGRGPFDVVCISVGSGIGARPVGIGGSFFVVTIGSTAFGESGCVLDGRGSDPFEVRRVLLFETTEESFGTTVGHPTSTK